MEPEHLDLIVLHFQVREREEGRDIDERRERVEREGGGEERHTEEGERYKERDREVGEIRVDRQNVLTTSRLYTQFDPVVSKLTS